MATQVFISWSGELSRKLAEVVRTWLPATLQFVKPYFTPVDIEKGTKWVSEISTELDISTIGIICLTSENLNNPWILFEAGALSKKFESRVCTLLFGLEPTNVTGPLTLFQHTKFTKEDFKKLIETINNSGGDSKLPTYVLHTVFERFWPDLQTDIARILTEYQPVGKDAPRPVPEMVKEILELTRLHVQRDTPKGFYSDLYQQYRRQWANRGLTPPLDMMGISNDPRGNVVVTWIPPVPEVPSDSSSTRPEEPESSRPSPEKEGD